MVSDRPSSVFADTGVTRVAIARSEWGRARVKPLAQPLVSLT
jgi:hypothetical protein